MMCVVIESFEKNIFIQIDNFLSNLEAYMDMSNITGKKVSW